MASKLDSLLEIKESEVIDVEDAAYATDGEGERPEIREGNQVEASEKDSVDGDTANTQDGAGAITIPLEVIESWEKRLVQVGDATNSDWRDQIEELRASLRSEIQRLKQLQDIQEKPTETDVESEPDPPRNSTSELKFAPWKKIVYKSNRPDIHCAIEVPFNQPTRDDLSPKRLDKPTQFDASVYLSEPPPGRKELPERIVINSVRLISFLDFKLHDGSLNWTDSSTFSILRPFKILVFFNDEIRRQMQEIDSTRRSIRPATEEEYDAEWKLNPPDDIDARSGEIAFTRLTVSELTGLLKDLRALVKFMDDYIQPAIQRSLIDPVYFWDLWYVFPAGSLIYIKDQKIPQKIWKVIQRTGGRRFLSRPTRSRSERGDWYMKCTQFVIDCYHLDFDGNRYVPTYYRISIDPFEEAQSITSLPVLPFEVAEKQGLVDREANVDRGSDFVRCTKPSHREYRGRNQLLKPDGSKIVKDDADIPENATKYSEWIESEVMVDFERALQEVPTWRPYSGELSLYRLDENEYDGWMDSDHVWDRKLSDQIIDQESEKWHKWDQNHPPTEEEDLLLLPDRVFAFVFRTRKWACLKLGKDERGEERLRIRNPRKEPWNDLQLPDGHKRLVQSLIESHSDDNTSKSIQFDLVGAKGKGVIILLHGVPGVGKTSTAECAAEANHKPLLPITCGDLGSNPRDVETKLQEAFQLAQLWKCVLLLDEADIFLAQRSDDDIQRNALVSVFLRVMEYYEGILFLTTNRVGVFDEAFKSRIHMALYYPPLEWKYTKRIWDTHLIKLQKSGLVEVDQDDILEYAENFFEKQSAKDSPVGPVWNGRQIRNAFQSAVALAGFRHQIGKIRLEREHLQRVSNVSNEFNNYLWNIKCQSDADKASKWGYRFDQYRSDPDLHLKSTRTRSVDQSMTGFGQSFQQQAVANPNGQSQGFGQGLLSNSALQLGQNPVSSFQQQPVAQPTGQTQGFGQGTLSNASQQLGQNPLSSFQQQNGVNSTGQSQGFFSTNGAQGTAQPQGQFSHQPLIQQQPQQQPQYSFQPVANQQTAQPARANVQLQAQYSMNTGQHGTLG